MSIQPAKVHYPTDFLVNGGPPFDVRCPLVPPMVGDNDAFHLSCQLTDDAQVRFYVHAQGRVLAESNNYHDIIAYLKDYMTGVRAWAAALGS